VLALYVIAMSCMGVAMAIVFQLAHVVEDAEFPLPVEETNKMENAWAVHQIETTVDFARSSKVCSWLMGGLNFQVEHHLFPKICHINYPEMSKVVEQTCKEFGVRFSEHKTFAAGVASHYRFLRKMGRADSVPAMA
jgi:linoleoyl-CoA desaturase